VCVRRRVTGTWFEKVRLEEDVVSSACSSCLSPSQCDDERAQSSGQHSEAPDFLLVVLLNVTSFLGASGLLLDIFSRDERLGFRNDAVCCTCRCLFMGLQQLREWSMVHVCLCACSVF
jgi:hypothetical protein